MRILLADDDIRIGKHIRQALIAEGYAVDYAQDGDEAHWLADNNNYDAIILDVMMPLRDGFTVARSLRRKDNQTPVLFLTAKGEVEDKVRGLDVGGDDYMVKPFSVVELLARLRALLRRQRPQASNLLRFEDLELDLVARQARRADKIIELDQSPVCAAGALDDDGTQARQQSGNHRTCLEPILRLSNQRRERLPAEARYPEAWHSWPLDDRRNCFEQPVTVQRVGDPQGTILVDSRAYLAHIGV